MYQKQLSNSLWIDSDNCFSIPGISKTRRTSREVSMSGHCVTLKVIATYNYTVFSGQFTKFRKRTIVGHVQ